MPADPKPSKRIVDPRALALARLRETACAACGVPPGSIHHVIPRGERGDDVAGNLLGLCGSGTTGCHGAYHGNPYETLTSNGDWERRDAYWVSVRIGARIAASTDILDYVFGKLGESAAREYLRRRYYVDA